MKKGKFATQREGALFVALNELAGASRSLLKDSKGRVFDSVVFSEYVDAYRNARELIAFIDREGE
jgi:hypothetical protein